MVKGRHGERVRLYVRGTILGCKRSKSNQYPITSLAQIEGVNPTEEVSWYAGKRMANIYKAKVKKMEPITASYGGAQVRVFMYPSYI
ncbi:Translation protein, beta-barrel domain superfamily [Sesbania bispinosa]|nr:Translation protein, beta-barrel domain superfamily [Sesbania bispinosa]